MSVHCIKKIFLIFWVCAIALSTKCVFSQKCTELNQSKKHQIQDYIIARYKVASQADIILLEVKQVNDSCFWNFRYETTDPKREINLYASPDGSYLFPDLYDTHIDPLKEESLRKNKIANALAEGISPEIGSKNSPVTIVIFSDFQCPYCKRMSDALIKEYISTELIPTRVIFKNFPLPMHRWAMTAAEMAECVSLQNPSEFWKIHNYIFDNQRAFTGANIKEKLEDYVKENIKLDQVQYSTCVTNDLALGPIKKDVDLGQKNGVSSTPTIFINGAIYSGAKSSDEIKKIVESIAANAKNNILLPSTKVIKAN